MHIQTQEYVDKNGFICKHQSGFRANCSTDSYLVQLTDFILREFDKGFQTEMILVDLQKSLWHVKITLYFYKKWNVLVLTL